MDAIKTSGLTKSYGSKRAVDDMSLTVGAGEIYGFVGRNGAGKSTVMKMLAGLVPPTSGEIEVLGERQTPGNTSRRLGALIESPGIHPGLSGLDNVMVRALALGMGGREVWVHPVGVHQEGAVCEHMGVVGWWRPNTPMRLSAPSCYTPTHPPGARPLR